MRPTPQVQTIETNELNRLHVAVGAFTLTLATYIALLAFHLIVR